MSNPDMTRTFASLTEIGRPLVAQISSHVPLSIIRINQISHYGPHSSVGTIWAHSVPNILAIIHCSTRDQWYDYNGKMLY